MGCVFWNTKALIEKKGHEKAGNGQKLTNRCRRLAGEEAEGTTDAGSPIKTLAAAPSPSHEVSCWFAVEQTPAA